MCLPIAEGGKRGACGSTSCPAKRSTSRSARRYATRRAPGGQSGVRRRRVALLHDERRAAAARPRCRCIRISADGARAAPTVEIANPTSLARWTRRAHVRVEPIRRHTCIGLIDDERAEVFATELGMATGLAFGAGRRPVCRRSLGHDSSRRSRIGSVEPFATIAARASRRFTWRCGPDDAVYVTAGPTLATHDVVYRITRDRHGGRVLPADSAGSAGPAPSIPTGALYVVDALGRRAPGLLRSPSILSVPASVRAGARR